MSTTVKKVVVGTRQRAISDDINVLQSFRVAQVAELLRYREDVNMGDFDDGQAMVENLTLASPVSALIHSGLLVTPVMGSVSMTVSAGSLGMLDPTGVIAGVDSAYNHIVDPGIAGLGVLTMTAGAFAGIRIDVVECQRAPGVVTEYQSMDIFDPATGTFTASSIPKVSGDALTYRVRLGTAGSGFPGTASGWLPLMVMSVPAGATTLDQATCWDVRPLLSDRSHGQANFTSERPAISAASYVNAITPTAVTGLMQISHKGRLLGGKIRSGSVIADDNANIDLTNPANQDSTLALVANRPVYVYLCAPYGLPRWSRYTNYTTGARTPRAPRGLMLVSSNLPDSTGRPLAALQPPTVTGLVTAIATADCVLAFSTYTTGAAAIAGVFGTQADGYTLCDGAFSGHPMTVAGTTTGLGTAIVETSFTLTSGVHFPANARELLVDARVSLTASGTGTCNDTQVFLLACSPNGGPPISARGSSDGGQTVTAGTYTPRVTGWIPIPRDQPGGFTVEARVDIEANTIISGFTASGQELRVLGWKT